RIIVYGQCAVSQPVHSQTLFAHVVRILAIFDEVLLLLVTTAVTLLLLCVKKQKAPILFLAYGDRVSSLLQQISDIRLTQALLENSHHIYALAVYVFHRRANRLQQRLLT